MSSRTESPKADPLPHGQPAPEPETDQRRRRSDASRASLLQATIRSIAERGLEATTLSSVSELSGLSRGLVAFHFASKERLIAAAIAHANGLYDASWDRHIRSSGVRGPEQIARVMAHDVAFGLARTDLVSFWYAVWGEARAKAIYREQALPMDGRYVAEIAAMLRRSGVPDAEPRARLTNAVILGLWLEMHLDPGVSTSATLRLTAAVSLEGVLPGWTGPLPEIAVEA